MPTPSVVARRCSSSFFFFPSVRFVSQPHALLGALSHFFFSCPRRRRLPFLPVGICFHRARARWPSRWDFLLRLAPALWRSLVLCRVILAAHLQMALGQRRASISLFGSAAPGTRISWLPRCPCVMAHLFVYLMPLWTDPAFALVQPRTTGAPGVGGSFRFFFSGRAAG